MNVSFNLIALVLYLVFLRFIDGINLNLSKKSYLRYLETNCWEAVLGRFELLIDPVLYSPLDFGIPLLYSGEKRYIDGRKELESIRTKNIDKIVLSQGLDDHAHSPTLKFLRSNYPSLSYIAPPSAVSVLKSCNIAEDKISIISPGQTITLTKGNEQLQILATTGALVGPPWQPNENGYIFKLSNPSLSVYYEPHCMYDNEELKNYQADYVISPVVSQELPFYTLVAGGKKAIDLGNILKAKAIIPMANGELKQSGLLSSILISKGSFEDAVDIAKQSERKINVVSVRPGQPLYLDA